MEMSDSMESDLNQHSESDDPNGEGEGVWSEKIEQCFQEALIMFPPCGRRKHILQEEGGGKMYGRNELIARHILFRTGQSRTRKQVSSHIQVLARRRAKGGNSGSASNSSQMINGNGNEAGCLSVSPSSTAAMSCSSRPQSAGQLTGDMRPKNLGLAFDLWDDRPIVTPKIRLVEFSAFIERRYSNPTPMQQQQQQPLVANHNRSHQHHHPQPANHFNFSHHHIQSQQSPYGQASPATTPSWTQASPSAVLMSPSVLPTMGHQVANGHHHPPPPQTLLSNPTNTQHYLYSNGANTANNHPHQHQSSNVISSSSNSTSASSSSTSLTSTSSSANQANQSARHCYIKIDYSQPPANRPAQQQMSTNKLETINIREIEDYFPEISGPNGLYQRGPKEGFFLVKFWADLSNDYDFNPDDQNSSFGFSSRFEMAEPHYKDITCSTKACSYGSQVVEKVEKIYGTFNSTNGRYSYDINRSPMCDFMIHFIRKLRQLTRTSHMNSVLENFTVLQVITCESTNEILLCLAYVFEVPEQSNGPQYHVYKLTSGG